MMKKTFKTIAVMTASLLFALCMAGSNLSAQEPTPEPSTVTGGGTFIDIGWWASPLAVPPGDFENLMGSMETVKFSVSIQAQGTCQIRFDSPSLREFWGGILHLSGPWDEYLSNDPWMQDNKPAQQFHFLVNHPEWGDLRVFVFLNDNWTPGAVEDPLWADWVGIVIEPADGDGLYAYEPFNYLEWNGIGDFAPRENDNLFGQVGILTRGNVMDHRFSGASASGHGKKKTPIAEVE